MYNTPPARLAFAPCLRSLLAHVQTRAWGSYPENLLCMVGLLLLIAQLYLRRFLARPASTDPNTQRQAVPGEIVVLVEELRAIVQVNPGGAPALGNLWAAVTIAANR